MEILGLRVREQEAGSREQENKYIGKSFVV